MMINERMYTEEDIDNLLARIEAVGYTGREPEITRMRLSEIEKFLDTIQ